MDEGLEHALDVIKSNEKSIYGRGHVETIRFLANYYKNHTPLEQLRADIRNSIDSWIQNLDANTEKALERTILKASAKVITNLVTLTNDFDRTIEKIAPKEPSE